MEGVANPSLEQGVFVSDVNVIKVDYMYILARISGRTLLRISATIFLF